MYFPDIRSAGPIGGQSIQSFMGHSDRPLRDQWNCVLSYGANNTGTTGFPESYRESGREIRGTSVRPLTMTITFSVTETVRTPMKSQSDLAKERHSGRRVAVIESKMTHSQEAHR
jgi:hypothetical protein